MARNTVYFIIGAAALIYLLTMKTAKAFASPTLSGKVRGCDPFGCGNFGAPRGARTHGGIDFVAVPGQDIYSPITGIVTKHARPYANDTVYTGIEISNGTYKVQMFYLTPSVAVGTVVHAGQKIGSAQNIAAKYGSQMTNHVHCEVYDSNGHIIDPTKLFLDTPVNLSIVLHKGMTDSPEVARLQQLLGIVVDGDFGPQTELALIAKKGVRQLALKDF